MFRHHSLVRNGKTSDVQKRCIADESTPADSIKDTRFDGNNCLASQAIAKNHLCASVRARVSQCCSTRKERSSYVTRKSCVSFVEPFPRNPFAIRRRSIANFYPTRDQHTFRMVLILAQKSNTPPELAILCTSKSSWTARTIIIQSRKLGSSSQENRAPLALTRRPLAL